MTTTIIYDCAIPRLIADWNGPYSWPGFESDNGLPTLPQKNCGVYLQTVEYQSGYLIYLAGHSKDIRTRFKDHERNRRIGSQISIFDIDQMKRGVRRRVWNGYSGWWKNNAAPEYLRERNTALGYPLDWGVDIQNPETRKAVAFGTHWKMVLDASIRQCIDTRIFIAEFGPEERLRRRLESGIMDRLAKAPSPFSDIPDKGMSLSRLIVKKGEKPICVENRMTVHLHEMLLPIEI